MLKDERQLVELPAELKQQSDKAFLLDFGHKTAWIPKSLAEWSRKGYYNIAEFKAKELGLI